MNPVAPLLSLALLLAPVAPFVAEPPVASLAPTDRLSEAEPEPPRGALEEGLTGPVYTLYASAISAMRAGRNPEALALLREARTVCYREYESGTAPRRLGYRHFVRLVYVEEEQAELVELQRQLARHRDPLAIEDRMLLVHERALLLHNQFLTVRSFMGLADERLLSAALQSYEEGLNRPSPLRTMVQIGYAALLAERGDRHGAQAAFSRLREEDLTTERFDLPVAYYHLAMGDRSRAMSRLQLAATRDSWDHSSANQDGRSLRFTVYRMNDFDRLRDHPRFADLVTGPEEQEGR